MFRPSFPGKPRWFRALWLCVGKSRKRLGILYRKRRGFASVFTQRRPGAIFFWGKGAVPEGVPSSGMTPNFLREGVWQAAHAAHVLPCHAGVNGLGDTSRGRMLGSLNEYERQRAVLGADCATPAGKGVAFGHCFPSFFPALRAYKVKGKVETFLKKVSSKNFYARFARLRDGFCAAPPSSPPARANGTRTWGRNGGLGSFQRWSQWCAR